MNKLISFYFYLLLLYFNMLPKKTKNKIKKSVPPIGMVGTNKKNLKKKSHHLSLSRADTCQEGGSFPPFETTGMRKTTKKNPKNESGSFWWLIFKGVRLEIFFGIRVRNKKIRQYKYACRDLYVTKEGVLDWDFKEL